MAQQTKHIPASISQNKINGPDQTRSWIIALCGCVISFMLSGINRASGVMYVSLIDHYTVTRQEANLPFAARSCLRSLAGPVAGVLGHRFGVRKIIVLGCFLSVCGITLCAFAPNIAWITILWGILNGFGVSLGFNLFPVAVNQYFLKHRSTASGLALSGACLGSFIFPPIVEFLDRFYGLPGLFLILGGIVMHVIPAAMLMRKPPWLRNHTKDTTAVATETTAVTMDTSTDPKETATVAKETTSTNIRRYNIYSSLNIYKVSNEDQHENLYEMQTKIAVLTPESESIITSTSKANAVEYVKNLNLTEHNAKGVEHFTPVSPILTDEIHSTQDMNKPIESRGAENPTTVFKDLKLLLSEPIFYIISVSFAIFDLVLDPFITIIVDYVTDKGIDKSTGKFFISLFSGADLFGRLCFGWVTDGGFMSFPKFMSLSQAIQGVAIVMMSLFDGVEITICLVAVYGVAAGITFVIFPVLVSKYLSKYQSLAIGCITFLSGLASFSVPPLIGHFRDDIGSYDGMLQITGGLSIAMAVVWLFQPKFVMPKY